VIDACILEHSFAEEDDEVRDEEILPSVEEVVQDAADLEFELNLCTDLAVLLVRQRFQLIVERDESAHDGITENLVIIEFL
jgi:hypothetical protein